MASHRRVLSRVPTLAAPSPPADGKTQQQPAPLPSQQHGREVSSIHLYWATREVPSCKHGCTCFALPLPGASPILVGRSLAVKLSPCVICRMGVLRTRLPARVFAAPKPLGGRAGRLSETQLRVPGPSTTCLPPPLRVSRVPRINLAPRMGYPTVSWEGCLGRLKLARFSLAGLHCCSYCKVGHRRHPCRAGGKGESTPVRREPCSDLAAEKGRVQGGGVCL